MLSFIGPPMRSAAFDCSPGECEHGEQEYRMPFCAIDPIEKRSQAPLKSWAVFEGTLVGVNQT